MVTVVEKRVLHRIEKLEQDVKELKETVDSDSVLSEGDYDAIAAYRKEKSAGTLASHDEVKKQ